MGVFIYADSWRSDAVPSHPSHPRECLNHFPTPLSVTAIFRSIRTRIATASCDDTREGTIRRHHQAYLSQVFARQNRFPYRRCYSITVISHGCLESPSESAIECVYQASRQLRAAHDTQEHDLPRKTVQMHKPTVMVSNTSGYNRAQYTWQIECVQVDAARLLEEWKIRTLGNHILDNSFSLESRQSKKVTGK